jgi:hypothetical protein
MLRLLGNVVRGDQNLVDREAVAMSMPPSALSVSTSKTVMLGMWCIWAFTRAGHWPWLV